MTRIMASNWPDSKQPEKREIETIWVVTACLFAAAITFAAFSGWVMTDKLADRALLKDLVQETANVRGEIKGAADQITSINGKLSGARNP